MALIATAMRRYVVISESPNKDNIKYSLAKISASNEETITPLAEEVQQL